MNVKCHCVLFAILSCGLLQADELPYWEPEVPEQNEFSVQLTTGGAVAIRQDKRSYRIDADFSLRPGWANFEENSSPNFVTAQLSGDTFTAATETFSVSRTLRRDGEAVVVSDTIRNLTDQNLPLMYRQKMQPGALKEYRICGYRIYSKRGNGSNSVNSTVICMPQEGGSIGMLALNDVFRVHFRGFAARGFYGIADDNLVLRPGATQEMSFAVFPLRKDGYYDQINAMRRFLGVNYEIARGFAFISPNPEGVKTFHPDHDRIGMEDSVETLAEWLKNKSADYVCGGAVSALGERSHGTAWNQTARPDVHLAFQQKLRQARPTVECFHYFHCFLDVKSAMTGTFDDARILNPSGKQADYRNPDLPLFLPIEGNDWSKMQEARLIRLRDEYKLDGIFWDEFTYSATEYHFGEPWDGVSGDMDPRTHEITRLKSSVILLTLPWRLRMLEMFSRSNLKLIANGGGGYTKTMSDEFKRQKFLAFMETGSVTNLYCTHLATPIGLGDHLTERTELDCYRNMVRYLDFGSVYFYYHQQVEPFTHPTLSQYQFPITPVRLGEGFIIGKERILTNRSGYYSFGGNEEADLHFFAADGREVSRPSVKLLKDGKTYYKIELSEFESCALVRK